MIKAYERLQSGQFIQKIWKARKQIKPIISTTSLIHSLPLSEKVDSNVYLKLENLQKTGSFKVRGAANKILNLTEEEKRCGVATFSTGNHGLAVAYVAQKLGIQSTICISNRVPKAKVDALKKSGAQIEMIGDSQDDAEKYCYELEERYGMTVVKPFDDLDVIAGQGTIGFEILEEVPDLEALLVPLSGGGLLAGTALALKSINPSIQVIGVSMERSPVMYESIKVGNPVVLREQYTLADSLLGGIGLNNEYTFNMIKENVDDLLLVSEEEIAEGMGFMIDAHRMVVEGAAAVGMAAILNKKLSKIYRKIGTIVTGCNVDLSVVTHVLQNYVQKDG
ncbi:hydroxyectoine utilization dehydratase EutB [Niallia oryzisoli]|uniref:Hydroxyectoine utilization dehydratase EutB n=1 Tax=Niallia oryzisoli TaxID=1737571 RepID=A0ABZ2CDE5_9BACI